MRSALVKGGFHGVEQSLRTFSGARSVRVVHPPGQEIGLHRHDRPFLMLVALGDYVERHEQGELRLAGPSAVLHPARTCHANRIGGNGMETVSIEFDADWIRTAGFDPRLERSLAWMGGTVISASRKLSMLWRDGAVAETEVTRATRAFLRLALASGPVAQPAWLCEVVALLDEIRPPSTAELARRLRLCPAWLARSYLHATGEGIHHTIRRKRVERAMMLLRATEASAAEIATATGFCDQSHMNRGFRAVAGRTPMQVRGERDGLTGLRAF